MGQQWAPCCNSDAENEASANAVTVYAEGNERDYNNTVPYQASPGAVSGTAGDKGKQEYGSLVCEFSVNGESKTATFFRKPLGITFANRVPLSITKIAPGTDGDVQGVQPGWVFTKVGGVPLAGMDLEAIMELIKERSANLAPASTPDTTTLSVTFEFVDPQGQIKEATFYKRPLGMTFANKLPLAVIKMDPGGEAEKQGVQSGWLFNKVAGIPVSGLKLEQIVTLILENSVHLPVK